MRMASLGEYDLVVAASGVRYRSRMIGQPTPVDSTVSQHHESLVMVLHHRHGPWSQSPTFAAGLTVISHCTTVPSRRQPGRKTVPGQSVAAATIGQGGGAAPREPWNGTSPKAKMPPSSATIR